MVLSVTLASFLRRANHSIDAAAGGIIDKREIAVPKGIGHVNDVGLREFDRDVTVGIAGG